VFFAALTLGCGSSANLEGLSLSEIEIEGEHAEDVKADLEEALRSAGATLNQPGEPKLKGTLTWEWAGEGAEPYPTLVKIFMQSEPEDRKLTISSQYEVPEGAQPRDVAHYRAQIVERIVSRIAAQNRPAS
jgi:hypothetical protein